jgi:hypothetical protein
MAVIDEVPGRRVTVRGSVSVRGRRDGAPEATVGLYVRTNAGDVLVGSGLTDKDGDFEVALPRGAAPAAAGREPFVLRVLGEDGRVLGESDEIPVPKRSTSVRLDVEGESPDASELARVFDRTAAHLGARRLSDLRRRELTDLAKKSGETVERVVSAARAERLSANLGVPLEPLYGLAREGGLHQLDELTDASPSSLRKTLRSAERNRVISTLDDVTTRAIVDGLGRERSARTPVSDLLPEKPTALSKKISAALERAKISTLEELRSAGGAGRIAELDAVRERGLVKELDAHAHLSVLTSDAKTRRKLIDAGLTSVSGIAAKDSSTFARELRGQIKRDEAIALHEKARLQHEIANNLLTEWRSIDPSKTEPPPLSLEVVPVFIAPYLTFVKCGCEDCESAVGPLAYLADLMSYVKDSVRDRAQPALRIDWHFLEEHLRQPFGRLPATCEAVDASVRQVRIAIEVLRSYLAKNPPTLARQNALDAAERQYLREVYDSLLSGIGTSSAEIRLAQGADQEVRRAIQDRLGLPRAGNSLAQLFLDTETPVTAAENASLERDIEQVFGLRDTRRSPLEDSLKATLVDWRRARLRELWSDQDWPDDLPSAGRPIVDPDVIGPDDFRKPEANNHPFRLWRKRRRWVDDRLAELAASTVAEMFDWMYSDHEYVLSAPTSVVVKWPTPKRQLQDIYERLLQGALDAQTQTKFDKYGLDVDALNRLMDLKRKEAEAADPRNQGPDETELSEARSIVVQALKRLLFADWRKEEEDQSVAFGPQDFWISLRDPVEGEWPPSPWPRPAHAGPFVDPELLKPSGLPDSAFGDRARTLYADRVTQLAKIRDDLKTARENPAQGFARMLEDALGSPLPIDLDQTLTDLASSDPTTSAQAEADVRVQLHLTPESFRTVMVVRAKDAETDPYRKPTAAEYAEVYAILASAQKERTKYADWVTKEADQSLEYWGTLKARLPLWRASSETRQEWQRLLRRRMSSPIIDPDLLSQDYLIPPRTAIPPWDIWMRRQGEIEAARHQIATASSLNVMVQDTLGVSLADLLAIDDASAQGEPIVRRLDQLFGLSQAAFDHLVRVGRLAQANQSIQPEERNAFYDILTQAWKRGKSLDWKTEERPAITLSPDHFRLPPPDPLVFPPPQRRSLPRWRSTLEALLDWEDKLRARIDQDATIAEGVDQIVASSEEALLPELRNALVAAASVPTAKQGDRAKWLSDLLLIDMKAAGCGTTTRVAQAIETIQSLVFLIRSGQIRDTAPFETLTLKDDALTSFDEDWAWMGSYATWRAAMFVFVYPDNILLPSLRTDATPAFSSLVRELRSLGRVTPAQARDSASMYEDYCRDVLSLESPWGVSALVRTEEAGHAETRLFLIARAAQSDKLYWCTRAASKAPSSQTFWQEIPGLKAVVRLIGAVEYAITPATRYVFVFAETAERGERKLVFSTYDLEQRVWSTEATELKPPDDKPFPTDIWLLQSPSSNSPPTLYMKFADGSDGTRSLGATGKDWQREPLSPVNYEEELATVLQGRRHEYAGVDGMTPADGAPDIYRVMNWLVAANDVATKAKYAAGFPTFRQRADIFDVIGLTDVLVDVRSANDLFDTAAEVSSANELSLLVFNTYSQARLAGYMGGLPLSV